MNISTQCIKSCRVGIRRLPQQYAANQLHLQIDGIIHIRVVDIIWIHPNDLPNRLISEVADMVLKN